MVTIQGFRREVTVGWSDESRQPGVLESVCVGGGLRGVGMPGQMNRKQG